MTIHKEGYSTIGIVIAVELVIAFAIYSVGISDILFLIINLIFLAFAIFIISFFRLPKVVVEKNEGHIIAPADGKVVVIEEVIETEYFKDKRLMVSIFMSPLNVHVNVYPFKGVVSYFKYHPGKFLVASLPKAATENERTTCVVKAESGKEVLIRQVAGAVARRIVWYAEEGLNVDQCDELGFIKFGSRVDLYLPLGTKLNVELGDIVKGKRSIVGNW